MSSTMAPANEHPIMAAASDLGAVLAGVAEAPAWSLGVGGQASVIVALSRVRAGLDELELRVLAAADRNDVAAVTGGVVDGGVAGARHGPPGRCRARGCAAGRCSG